MNGGGSWILRMGMMVLFLIAITLQVICVVRRLIQRQKRSGRDQALETLQQRFAAGESHSRATPGRVCNVGRIIRQNVHCVASATKRSMEHWREEGGFSIKKERTVRIRTTLLLVTNIGLALLAIGGPIGAMEPGKW